MSQSKPMKIPDKVKRAIVAGIRKNEYDLGAIGLGDLPFPSFVKIIDAVKDAIDDIIEKAENIMLAECIKAILDDMRMWFDCKNGDLIMTFCLWEELWKIPLDYRNFKFLEFQENDIEDEPAVENVIEQMSKIITQLQEHNKNLKRQEI